MGEFLEVPGLVEGWFFMGLDSFVQIKGMLFEGEEVAGEFDRLFYVEEAVVFLRIVRHIPKNLILLLSNNILLFQY